MKHVDDSILHALLDGQLDALHAARALPDGTDRRDIEAHLHACTECRARLDDERAIREGASRVLHDAALTTVDVPPFEMVAFGRQPGGSQPVRRRTAIPMAWAATVMLALGAGWWGSSLRTQEQAAVAPLHAPAAPLVNAEAAAPVMADADSPLAAHSALAARDAAPAPAGAPLAAAVPPVARDEPPAAVDTPAPAAAPPAGVASASAARPSATDIVVTEAVQGRALARQNASRTDEPAVSRLADPRAESLRARTQSPVGRDTTVIAPAPFDAAPTALPPQAFHDAVQAARLGQLQWRPVDAAGARVAGLHLLTIAGMAPTTTESAGLHGEGILTRVTHTLDDGAALQLVIWHEPDASTHMRVPAADQAKAETRAVPIIVVSNSDSPLGRELLAHVPSLDTFVLLRGDVDGHRLRALAERLVIVR